MANAFRGAFAYRSNMYSCPVSFQGILYNNSEAAFQAQKCILQQDKEKFAFLSGPDAKRLGKTIPLIEDWEDIKLDIMYNVVKEKFIQNPSLKQLLISSTDDIAEENTWGDTFWGTCNGYGKNHLGKILMKVRDELK